MARLIVDTIVAAYRAVHDQFRALIAASDAEALAWSPGPDANTVTILTVHVVGSEGEVWRLVAGAPSSRDRAAEFVSSDVSRDQLLALLDAADRLLGELAPQIGAAELQQRRERPGRAAQSGLHWLVTNYGHAREHLAHAELTLQLRAARTAGAAAVSTGPGAFGTEPAGEST